MTLKPPEIICCCLCKLLRPVEPVDMRELIPWLLLLLVVPDSDDKLPSDNLGGMLCEDSGTNGGEKQLEESVMPVKLATPDSSNVGSTFNRRPVVQFGIMFAALRTDCGGLGVRVGGDKVLETSEGVAPPRRKS